VGACVLTVSTVWHLITRTSQGIVGSQVQGFVLGFLQREAPDLLPAPIDRVTMKYTGRSGSWVRGA
jgi:hypothetical protein